MIGQTEEGTNGLFSSAARRTRLGDLWWGTLPLALWGLLFIALLSALPREGNKPSVPAGRQARVLLAGESVPQPLPADKVNGSEATSLP